jgi:hypothetical protein
VNAVEPVEVDEFRERPRRRAPLRVPARVAPITF